MWLGSNPIFATRWQLLHSTGYHSEKKRLCTLKLEGDISGQIKLSNVGVISKFFAVVPNGAKLEPSGSLDALFCRGYGQRTFYSLAHGLEALLF